MTYLSIFEKFKILFDMLLDFEFILVFVILLMFFTFLYIIKKINTKKYILMLLVSFIVVFGISIIGNYDVLSNTFDNFTTIFFGNIYFPSIYVYISVLIISFIAFIVSILNIMIKKIYKAINSIMFIVNNILFIIILNIIAKNKIDIFSVNSLYTNTNLVVVLELSMGLFILWILSLIAIYVTNVICDRIANKKVIKNDVKEEVFNPVLEVNNELVCDTIDNDSDVFTEVEAISNVENNVIIEEVEIISDNENIVVIEEKDDNVQNDIVTNDNNITFNDILNGCVPVTYYDNTVNNIEYELVNPQMLYEDKYDKLLNNSIAFNDVNVLLDTNINEISNNVENNIFSEVELSIEEKTILEKEKASEERLLVNTISLNDLVHENDNSDYEIQLIDNCNKEEIVEEIVENKQEENNNTYTVDDYKKFIKMLNDIKNYSREVNINIEDAMAISLISNYSVDDCMMFKNILENNLN